MSLHINLTDYDCNDLWNEHTCYELDLHLVWHDNSGNWIPDEYRYHYDENGTLDWYSYCDFYDIHWSAPRLLPVWLIDDMDQYYRDQYYFYDNLEQN